MEDTMIECNFTSTDTFLILYAYISIPHQKCHKKSQLGWDHDCCMKFLATNQKLHIKTAIFVSKVDGII